MNFFQRGLMAVAVGENARKNRTNCWQSVAMLFFWYTSASAAVPALEPQQQGSPQVVVVKTMRDNDKVPYRKIFKGMAVFEENHRMAPAAALRFRVYPRAEHARFDDLVVTLTGSETDIPVELDENYSFSLPKNAGFAKDDVMVMTNKKAGTYAWRVDIRTPGLPPGTRRLGDLRLECKVDMKGAELRRLVRDPSIMALVALGDPCTYRTFQNPFFADRPVFNVTLVSGTRREAIAGEWMYANTTRMLPEAMYDLADWRYTRDRIYIPAIADVSWPDDTLVEFEYMDNPDGNSKPFSLTYAEPKETEFRP